MYLYLLAVVFANEVCSLCQRFMRWERCKSGYFASSSVTARRRASLERERSEGRKGDREEGWREEGREADKEKKEEEERRER